MQTKSGALFDDINKGQAIVFSANSIPGQPMKTAVSDGDSVSLRKDGEDDRHGQTSTLVISQLPTDQWYAVIGDNTLADAILDRLMYNAHRDKCSQHYAEPRKGVTNEAHSYGSNSVNCIQA